MVEMKMETEAALGTRAEGADRHQRPDFLSFGGDHPNIEATEGDGGFVDQHDLDVEDVLVVVVNLHSDRLKFGFDGSHARAVFFRHAWREGHAVLECGADETSPKAVPRF